MPAKVVIPKSAGVTVAILSLLLESGPGRARSYQLYCACGCPVCLSSDIIFGSWNWQSVHAFCCQKCCKCIPTYTVKPWKLSLIKSSHFLFCPSHMAPAKKLFAERDNGFALSVAKKVCTLCSAPLFLVLIPFYPFLRSAIQTKVGRSNSEQSCACSPLRFFS